MTAIDYFRKEYFDKGNDAYDNGDSETAIIYYTKLIEVCESLSNWERSAAYGFRGLAKSQLSDYSGAIDDFTQSIEFDPTNTDAWYNRGNAKLYSSDYFAAIEDFNKTIEIDPKCALAYNARGIAKFNLSNYEDAIKDYDTAIEIDPTLALAYNGRGNAKGNLNDYQGAIADLNKSIEIDPNDAMLYYNRGNAKRDSCDYQGAIADFTQSIKINPNYAAAYNNRGNIKLDFFKYSDAINDFSKAIEIVPQAAKYYYSRGNAKFDSSDYIGAIKDYTQAIEQTTENKQDFPNAYMNRGVSYTRTKQYEKAKEDFIKVKTDVLFVFGLGEDGEKVARMLLESDDFFQEAVEGCEKCKLESYKDFYIQSLKIITMLQIINIKELPAVHYTSKKVSEFMFFEGSSFQLSLANTSNDPTEGKTLFRYLSVKENLSQEVDYGAFVGCFILNKDSLNQFRLYGKTDNREGTGISIALNNRFFDAKLRSPRSGDVVEATDKKPVLVRTLRSPLDMGIIESDYKKITPEPLPLFRCIYIDPETNRVVSLGQKEEYVFYREDEKFGEEYEKYKKEINKTQEEVIIELEKLRQQSETLNHIIVHKLLLNLRFLIKHVAFKEEQECRIIQIKKYIDEEVKTLGERKYIDYLKLDQYNVTKICFGPKVEDKEMENLKGWGKKIDEYKQCLTSNGYKYESSTSPLAWSQNKKTQTNETEE